MPLEPAVAYVEGVFLMRRTMFRIHAVQTGRVQVKQTQLIGHGQGLRRRLAPLFDAEWSDWLPVYAYAIEHPEGVILVDTGANAGLLRLPRWHPYFQMA